MPRRRRAHGEAVRVLADAIATIVGLLAAEVFLIGFLLQRLDVLLDNTKSRIDRTRDRLEATPARALSFGSVSGDALECVSIIDDEMHRSRARTLLITGPAMCVLVWYLALRDGVGS